MSSVILKDTIMNKKNKHRDLREDHPGFILREKFLKRLGITAYRLAKETYLPQTRISLILKGERAITPMTAARFAKYLNTTGRYWLDLQADYDLEIGSREDDDLIKIEPYNFKNK